MKTESDFITEGLKKPVSLEAILSLQVELENKIDTLRLEKGELFEKLSVMESYNEQLAERLETLEKMHAKYRF